MKRGIIPTDVLTLAFAALFGAVIIARAPHSPSWPFHLLALGLTALLVKLLAGAPAASPFMRFVGPAYPLLIVTGYYTAIGTMNAEVGLNHDLWAQRADQALFGGPISITWHQTMPILALSWVLHICYVTYYPIVATVGLWHWRKTSRELYERAVFVIALGFYVCYLAFAVFPVTGPRYFFGAATGVAAEVWPARIVHQLLEGGSAYGTAFPSSHICACWCAVLATWRANRKLAIALGIPALGLALGTVYGQFHYAIDAICGAALAWLVLAAADPLRGYLRKERPITARAVPTQ